jgi:GT2 family glycosyltransferase
MFSIVIPSWNNLPYLRLCVESLRRNSWHAHQIVVHVNDGSDGTREWIAREGIEHTASDVNLGICFAVNLAAARARTSYVMYLNDDMVAAPGWDTALELALARVGKQPMFMLSGTMIEPVDTGNRCVVVADYGRAPTGFDLERFSATVRAHARADWLGATWPPTVVSRDLWHRVGGYSTEFSPGMGSDNDLSMKLWHAGCRIFLGVGDSLFYHFAKASTARIRKNDGRRQFLMKWGMTPSAFDRHCLRRGEAPLPGAEGLVLRDPEATWRWRLLEFKSALKRRLG